VKFLFLSSYAHLALDPASQKVSGGAELQLALLAKELASRGHEAILAGGDIGQPDGAQFQGVRTRNAGRFHTGRMGEMLGAIPRVFQVLREERPDYVMVLGWTAWLFVLLLFRPFVGYRLGFICGLDTEVNGEFRRSNPLRGGLFEIALRRCDVRFAMTRLQERLFRDNGMDCGFYRNLILPRSAPRTAQKSVDFLWIARCQQIKRPHKFLDLAEKLPAFSFEMICPSEDQALYREIEERSTRIPNLRLVERVPYHEVQARYDAARIFVNTSDWEGWPNSFIQAGQGGCAILSLGIRPDTLFDDYRLGGCADGDFDRLLELAGLWAGDQAATDAMGSESERFVREMHDNARETTAFLQGLPQ